ncbi:hypothetical protein [Shewanella sp. Actino-trap-3]|uniref:hypothetical protein n=1 Tax=Shewanella sp. Actino-trap-3 TaxID=2058331 RepID=UPI001E53A626|nr:hypothetical protein [Shewanella sp. Actino-trap-3]
MDKHNSNATRKMPWITISVIASIVLLFGLLLMVMPKGFKATHEQIGTGKPSVVFVYDPNLVASISQTEQMNEARAHLGDNVFFLLARVGTPEERRSSLNIVPALQSYYSLTQQESN